VLDYDGCLQSCAIAVGLILDRPLNLLDRCIQFLDKVRWHPAVDEQLIQRHDCSAHKLPSRKAE
jgi:hypothetical protein